jgi:hypothetical protein
LVVGLLLTGLFRREMGQAQEGFGHCLGEVIPVEPPIGQVVPLRVSIGVTMEQGS